jgi:hypothetical protein
MIIGLLFWLGCRTGAPPEVPAPEDGLAVVVKPGLRQEHWQNARCNDGTPWSYAVRRQESSTWVIELAGGYFCDDEFLWCRDRRRPMTSSWPQPDGGRLPMEGAGLFSTDPTINPTFARANHVLAHYCSSDLWLGTSSQRQPNSASSEGWWFAGRENARVLVEALRELEHLDDADPRTRILVVGTSAGGAGLVSNLDLFVQGFPQTAADGRLKIVLDGAWVRPPPDERLIPNVTRWGPLRGCADRSCLFASSWWPGVKETGLPVLVAVSGLDITQTPLFEVDTPEEKLAWQSRVKASLVEQGVPWVFSASQPYHTVAFEPVFDKGPPGKTFREVLDRFWAGETPEQVFLGY